MSLQPPTPSGYNRRSDVDRDYRRAAAPDLWRGRIVIGESDLWVLANTDCRSAITARLKILRRQLKEYLFRYPDFQTCLTSYPMDPTAPEIVQWMIRVTAPLGIGPMASVAGAFAGMLGLELATGFPELIIENGGDIYLRSQKERVVAIFAGSSPFSNRIGLRIAPQPSGIGICTSAGTVGPSLSMGKSDAVVIIAPDTALADAAATAVGNRIQTTADLPAALAYARTIPGLSGVLLIKDDKLAVWGEVQLTPV